VKLTALGYSGCCLNTDELVQTLPGPISIANPSMSPKSDTDEARMLESGALRQFARAGLFSAAMVEKHAIAARFSFDPEPEQRELRHTCS
jgi:hypothetical protein